jgi:hypothetical protein
MVIERDDICQKPVFGHRHVSAFVLGIVLERALSAQTSKLQVR